MAKGKGKSIYQVEAARFGMHVARDWEAARTNAPVKSTSEKVTQAVSPIGWYEAAKNKRSASRARKEREAAERDFLTQVNKHKGRK